MSLKLPSKFGSDRTGPRKEVNQGKEGRLPREARKFTKGRKEVNLGNEGSQPREGRKST